MTNKLTQYRVTFEETRADGWKVPYEARETIYADTKAELACALGDLQVPSNVQVTFGELVNGRYKILERY